MSAPASSTEPELDSQLGNSGRGQLAAHTARRVCLCESATEPGEEGVVAGRGVGWGGFLTQTKTQQDQSNHRSLTVLQCLKRCEEERLKNVK